jgi:hypothetical protein
MHGTNVKKKKINRFLVTVSDFSDVHIALVIAL